MSKTEETPWFHEDDRFALTGADLERMRQEMEDADPVAYAKNGLDE